MLDSRSHHRGRVDIESMSLADIINTAFRVKVYQVSGPS